MTYAEWVMWFISEYVVPTGLLMVVAIGFGSVIWVLYCMIGGGE